MPYFISNKYKYVFLQHEMTASSSTAHALYNHYGGIMEREDNRKHAHYSTFL